MYEIDINWDSLKGLQNKLLKPIIRVIDSAQNHRVYLTDDAFIYKAILENQNEINEYENDYESNSLFYERYTIENDPSNFVGRNAGQDRLAIAVRFKNNVNINKTFVNILGGSGSSNSNNNKIYKIIANPSFPSLQPTNWIDVGNGSVLEYSTDINANEPQISGGRLLSSAIGQDSNNFKQPIVLSTFYKMKHNDIIVFSIRPISNTQVNVRLDWEEMK
jgi:hypothetical protein